MRLKGPHRPRPIRFLGDRTAGTWRVKLYGITAAGERPRPELVDAAAGALGANLPAPSEKTYGVGFAIAHDAADYCFVLIDWFSGENEIHQRLLFSPRDRPGELVPYRDAGIGCVWELAVTDFERRAWLEHVLANPDGPDLDAYLEAHFEGEV